MLGRAARRLLSREEILACSACRREQLKIFAKSCGGLHRVSAASCEKFQTKAIILFDDRREELVRARRCSREMKRGGELAMRASSLRCKCRGRRLAAAGRYVDYDPSNSPSALRHCVASRPSCASRRCVVGMGWRGRHLAGSNRSMRASSLEKAKEACRLVAWPRCWHRRGISLARCA